MQEISLKFSSSWENVSLAGSCIKALCTYSRFPDLEAIKIENSLVEALNNVVEHAYEGSAEGLIEIVFALFPDKIRIKVIDSGKLYLNPQKPALEFDPKDIAHLPEGGMGRYIIMHTMDEVLYEIVDNKNVLTMVKKLPPS